MMRRLLYDYNLQFFADESSSTDDNIGDDSTGEGSDNSSDGDGRGIDTSAFADIISEKDKKLEELEKEMKQLKKSNAELLLKINADKKSEIPIEQTIIDFCDTRKPVNRH